MSQNGKPPLKTHDGALAVDLECPPGRILLRIFTGGKAHTVPLEPDQAATLARGLATVVNEAMRYRAERVGKPDIVLKGN